MFAKIFRQIFDSSVAEDYLVRLVFQDLLVLADHTGIVEMRPEVIAVTTRVPLDIVTRALAKLQEPDPASRQEEEEGRRVVHLGHNRWKIIAHHNYRNISDENARRAYNAERQRKCRAGKKAVTEASGHTMSHAVTPVTPVTVGHTLSQGVAHTDTEADTDTEAEAEAGGAGGKAPALEGQNSGDAEGASVGTEPACLSVSFSSNDKNEAEASPVTPPSSPASPNRTLVLGGSPTPRQQKAHVTSTSPAQRPAPPVEPWDALDYVMAHWDDPGEFQGYPWKVVCRAVFYAWKLTDKPYWPTRGIDSVDALKRAIATMVAQTPEGTKVSGSATLILAPRRDPDPACPHCGGSGSVPNIGYVGDDSIGGGRLAEAYREFCWCTSDESGADRRPWKKWRRDAE